MPRTMRKSFDVKAMVLIAITLTATFIIFAHQFLGVGQYVTAGYFNGIAEVENAKN